MNKGLAKVVRKIAKSKYNTAKIITIEGDSSPIAKGELGTDECKISGYWYTKREIFSNKALKFQYQQLLGPRNRNLNNTRYVRSTYRIEVGRNWLMKYGSPFILFDVIHKMPRDIKYDYLMERNYTWESLNAEIAQIMSRDWSKT